MINGSAPHKNTYLASSYSPYKVYVNITLTMMLWGCGGGLAGCISIR